MEEDDRGRQVRQQKTARHTREVSGYGFYQLYYSDIIAGNRLIRC